LEISFISRKLEKEFNEGARLVKTHGPKRAEKIGRRVAELRAAITLHDLWPPKSGPSRCHELAEGNRKGKFHLSVDLDHPYRLIFTPAHDPIPTHDDGGLDWSKVTAITILGVENTHE
jgi:proteic killer suppression protein